MYNTNSLKAELNAKGGRLTPQRKIILEIFQNLPKGKHLSADDLFKLLEKRGQGIGLATIYRSLKLMTKMGILRELELTEAHKHYEINTTTSNHHHHIVCAQCNMTIEFDNSNVLKQAVKQVEKSHLELIDCQLIIYAVCPEAIRKGFPAIRFENWSCSRAKNAESKLEEDLLSN